LAVSELKSFNTNLKIEDLGWEMEIEALKIALKKMIIEECDKDIEVENISDDEQLIGGGDLDLDSLDALQISMCVQKQYGVRIENGPAARKALRSVSSLAKTILADANFSGASPSEKSLSNQTEKNS